MAMDSETRHLRNGELMLVFRHLAGDDIQDVADDVLQILKREDSAIENAQSQPMLHSHGQEIQATSFIISSARSVFEASVTAERYLSALNPTFRVAQEFPHGDGGYILIDHHTIPAPGS